MAATAARVYPRDDRRSAQTGGNAITEEARERGRTRAGGPTGEREMTKSSIGSSSWNVEETVEVRVEMIGCESD